MIYKKIATTTNTATARTNTLFFLWEKSVQETIATIRSAIIPTILMDDGFQMDDPIYDSAQSLIANTESFETPEWAAFHRSLTTTVIAYLNTTDETAPLHCEALGFNTRNTAPERIQFIDICLQNWQKKIQRNDT